MSELLALLLHLALQQMISFRPPKYPELRLHSR